MTARTQIDLPVGRARSNGGSVLMKLKAMLEIVLDSVGEERKDAFVQHRLWPQVSAAASDASRLLAHKT
jgi:hypothetical protein